MVIWSDLPLKIVYCLGLYILIHTDPLLLKNSTSGHWLSEPIYIYNWKSTQPPSCSKTPRLNTLRAVDVSGGSDFHLDGFGTTDFLPPYLSHRRYLENFSS